MRKFRRRPSSSTGCPGNLSSDRRAEESGALPDRRLLLDAAEHLHVPDPARRRAALENEAVDDRERIEKRRGETRHPVRHVGARRGLEEPEPAGARGDADRIARHAEPDLDLGADGNEIDVRHERLHDVRRDAEAVVPARGELDAFAHDDRGPGESDLIERPPMRGRPSG